MKPDISCAYIDPFKRQNCIAISLRPSFADWNRIFGEELYDHRFDADENINLVNRKELNTIRTTLKKQLRRQFR